VVRAAASSRSKVVLGTGVGAQERLKIEISEIVSLLHVKKRRRGSLGKWCLPLVGSWACLWCSVQHLAHIHARNLSWDPVPEVARSYCHGRFCKTDRLTRRVLGSCSSWGARVILSCSLSIAFISTFTLISVSCSHLLVEIVPLFH
jgi:hypothetical protein